MSTQAQRLLRPTTPFVPGRRNGFVLVVASALVAPGAATAAAGPLGSMVAATTAARATAASIVAQSGPGGLRSAEQLENLVAPIALFPDPLLAQTIAAANYPSKMVQASNWVAAGGLPSSNAYTQLPGSVQFFVNLPDLLATLATHRDWLGVLGRAYGAQPGDLMNAVQALRHRARDAGNLASNSFQTIVTDGPFLLIEPASPQFIPVPSYDRSTVFMRRDAGDGGVGAPVRFVASVPTSAVVQRIDCDWHAGRLTYGWGGWYSGEIGRTNAGGSTRPSASGTYYVLGNGPGYDGSGWRPNGTIVMPGSTSTQGQPLEMVPNLPLVEPTAPLMPATPVQRVQPLAPVQRLAPRAPVQALAYNAPVQPLAPVQPIPSNIAYQPPVPFGATDGVSGAAWTSVGGTAFGVGSGGYAAGARGARSFAGRGS
ncbi:MAG: DUF3300 domain-containing protein [Phycisphaerales bacterium]